MKVGNVILAIFFWLCIPTAFFFGTFFGIVGGGIRGGFVFGIGLPLLLFLLGVIALWTGREKEQRVRVTLVKKEILSKPPNRIPDEIFIDFLQKHGDIGPLHEREQLCSKIEREWGRKATVKGVTIRLKKILNNV